MELIKLLKNESKKIHWQDSINWLLWMFIGSLMPVWVTILNFLLTGRTVNLSVLTDNAEFALYSASFLSGSLFLVGRNYKQQNFPSFSITVLLLVSMLLLSSITYSLVSVADINNLPPTNNTSLGINQDMLGKISWVLLPIALLVSFIISVTENVRQGLDIDQARRRNLDDLNQDFDDLGDD